MLLVIPWLFSLVFGTLVNPIPKPQSIKWSGTPKVFDQTTAFTGDDQDNILSKQYSSMIDTLNDLKRFPAVPSSGATSDTDFSGQFPTLSSISVSMESSDVQLKYGVKESYHLQVNSNIVIESETVGGASNSLKTLQELIVFKDGKFYIEGDVDIQDEPLYSYQGLLIDSGRNFINKDIIMTQIDLVSLSKINVLPR